MRKRIGNLAQESAPSQRRARSSGRGPQVGAVTSRAASAGDRCTAASLPVACSTGQPPWGPTTSGQRLTARWSPLPPRGCRRQRRCAGRPGRPRWLARSRRPCWPWPPPAGSCRGVCGVGTGWDGVGGSTRACELGQGIVVRPNHAVQCRTPSPTCPLHSDLPHRPSHPAPQAGPPHPGPNHCSSGKTCVIGRPTLPDKLPPPHPHQPNPPPHTHTHTTPHPAPPTAAPG